MKKITGLLFSMELTGMLIFLFTISIGFATFIENDFGTLVAKARVYNAGWFEFLLLLLAVNLAGSIVKHKMYVRAKWPVFIFHVSFLVILLGAAITRYVGYEGVMTIREGQSSAQIMSADTYIRVWARNGQDQAYLEKKVFALPSKVSGFKENLALDEHDIKIEVIDYFVNASEQYVEGEGGEMVLWLVYADQNTGRQEIFLGQGQVERIGNYHFAFESEFEGAGISIFHHEGGLVFTATDTLEHMDMMSNQGAVVTPNTMYPFKVMNLYSGNNTNLVLKTVYESAVKKLVSTGTNESMPSMDAFTAKVTVDGQSRVVNVYGGDFRSHENKAEINGVEVLINYGAKAIPLPFSIHLDDFILDRYPGSNSPASYASQVTVIDNENNLEMPYRIYMNNVLNYRGYRFFQSSYDKDERGTVLSVNHDAPGTIITYIGYFLMTLGMILVIFYRKSRFASLLRKASEVRQSRKQIVTILLIAGFAFSLSYQARTQNLSDQTLPVISKSHAEAFGTLQVLGNDGRLEPVSTLASEVLRKIARKNTFEGMNPEQVFLGIMCYPQLWNNVPIIKVTHPQLKDFLGIEGKYASFSQIVNVHTGEYKIRDYVESAYAKKPAEQSKFDKDLIQVDERVNVYYMVYSGSFLKVFPIQGDINNTWVASVHSTDMFNKEDSTLVRVALAEYLSAAVNAVESGNWSEADERLEAIHAYQREHGSAIYLTEAKVGIEVFYNRFNIFKRLSMYYGLIGFVLLILHFINILKPRINLGLVIRIGSVMVFLLFLLHTAGLILRWYISGHAPWSNGYESMIYIAWATALSGLIFVWRSGITLSVTALLASLILAVAGMSWMDPEITTLVPVLKSYWLIIHVAVITASYGFLALGALLGFLNMVLMIMKSKKNLERINLTIKELSHINEMTLIIGLFLLTIGTFLGGVWANESWGRYWGWDPKETWALATIGFYSFVVHFRFIPGLRGRFAFNFASLISFGSVLMTYFGVNYYLSGLHSYAGGDPVPVPSFVYYALIVIGIVSVWAFISDRKYTGIRQG